MFFPAPTRGGARVLHDRRVFHKSEVTQHDCHVDLVDVAEAVQHRRRAAPEIGERPGAIRDAVLIQSTEFARELER